MILEDAIHVQAECLKSVLHDAQELVHTIQARLAQVQAKCDHKGTEEYRNHQVGLCPICRKEFCTKLQIDALFSE